MATEIEVSSSKIILFQPEIAQNVGTIIRLCACFGVQLTIIEPCGFPFSSKALRRAMMDYGKLEAVKRHTTFQKYSDHKILAGKNSRMILLTTTGNQCLWDFDFSCDDHLFFGNEGHGVPESVAKEANVPGASGNSPT